MKNGCNDYQNSLIKMSNDKWEWHFEQTNERRPLIWHRGPTIVVHSQFWQFVVPCGLILEVSDHGLYTKKCIITSMQLPCIVRKFIGIYLYSSETPLIDPVRNGDTIPPSPEKNGKFTWKVLGCVKRLWMLDPSVKLYYLEVSFPYTNSGIFNGPENALKVWL